MILIRRHFLQLRIFSFVLAHKHQPGIVGISSINIPVGVDPSFMNSCPREDDIVFLPCTRSLPAPQTWFTSSQASAFSVLGLCHCLVVHVIIEHYVSTSFISFFTFLSQISSFNLSLLYPLAIIMSCQFFDRLVSPPLSSSVSRFSRFSNPCSQSYILISHISFFWFKIISILAELS